jgi:hypothetical protein
MEQNVLTDKKICACGCGEAIAPYKDISRFKVGHGRRGKHFLNETGPNNKHWTGGRRISEHGYILVYYHGHPRARKSYVFKHILVYETYHKCCIPRYAAVHHIDGNKQNNNLNNLEAMTASHHATAHNLTRTYIHGRKFSDIHKLRISEALKRYHSKYAM